MPRRRGLLAGASGLALVAAILGAATAAALGSGDGLLSAALVLAFGSPILLIAHVFARRRPWRWSIRRQLSVGIGLTVASAIGGAEAVAALTSVSGRDALLLALALGCAATQGVWAARVVAGPVADDIEAARSSLQAIAEGSRAEPFRSGAARELVELSAAGERMSAQLDQRTAERDVADARRDAADAARDRADTARDDADAVRREMLAGLAHDLRTPLTSLRLLAEAIEAEANEDRRRRYARQLSTHVRSLDCLIDDLFELSRIEAGNGDWPLEHVRLHELVEETVDAFESTMAMKGIETQMRVSASLPPAWANPEKLQRVLFNLVQNAVRHTPPHGLVSVAAEAKGARIEVEVRDTGEGIGASERERVFEPFYRAGEETPGAAGLGLAICRAIVEAHGGSIWLAESSRGARIRFSLPSAPP